MVFVVPQQLSFVFVTHEDEYLTAPDTDTYTDDMIRDSTRRSAAMSRFIAERPLLSDCVAESLLQLTKAIHEPRQLTAIDLFVDVAKFGHGPSVEALRNHGIGPEEIEHRLATMSVNVLRRDDAK